MAYVKLFDVKNGKLSFTEHCYANKSLKAIIDAYNKDQALKILQYVFYLTCEDPSKNPYFNVPVADKEQQIIKELGIDFSLDDGRIAKAKEFCESLYPSKARRLYLDASIGLEKLGKYLRDTEIEAGRDGNFSTYVATLKGVGSIMTQFKVLENEYLKELQAGIRGGGEAAYDE